MFQTTLQQISYTATINFYGKKKIFKTNFIFTTKNTFFRDEIYIYGKILYLTILRQKKFYKILILYLSLIRINLILISH